MRLQSGCSSANSIPKFLGGGLAPPQQGKGCRSSFAPILHIVPSLQSILSRVQSSLPLKFLCTHLQGQD